MPAGGRRRRWTGYTPGGELLSVERDDAAWVVTCAGDDPVRHHVLDLALIQAIRRQPRTGWVVDRGEWARLIADSILAT